MEPITSIHNPQISELRKLRSRRWRERSGRFAAEGEDLLEEALRAGWTPEVVYFDAERPLDIEGVRCVAVDGRVLSSASSLGSGSRVIAVFAERWGAIDGAEAVVYLHEVGDPGNVGTIVRSAHAMAGGVVALGPGCADPFSPKAVRASMGSIFAGPPVRASFDEIVASGARTVALAPRAGTPLHELELGGRIAFCLGAERAGLPPELTGRCDQVAHIPMRHGAAESLNVAMAATLALYQHQLHRLSHAHD